MPLDIMVIKTGQGTFHPATPSDQEATNKLKNGQEYGVTLTQLRNGAFHRKLFKLLHFGYDNTERVTVKYKDQRIGQSFKSYRDGLVIRAGYHSFDVDNRGNVKLVAQSLSYTDCSQELVENIYSDVLDVLCKDFSGEYSRERLATLSEELMRYA